MDLVARGRDKGSILTDCVTALMVAWMSSSPGLTEMFGMLSMTHASTRGCSRGEPSAGFCSRLFRAASRRRKAGPCHEPSDIPVTE